MDLSPLDEVELELADSEEALDFSAAPLDLPAAARLSVRLSVR